MLNIKLLQTFKTAVDADSFQQAAKQLNYSHSTVSKHIRELEEEVGSPLFIDGLVQHGLTPIGELTYNYAEQFMSDFSLFGQRIDALKNQTTLVRIGGIDRYLIDFATNKVVTYHREHPDFQFQLVAKTSDETLQELNENKLDLGIIADRIVPAGYQSLIVSRESLVMAASKTTTQKIRKQHLTLEELPILTDKNASAIFTYALKGSKENHRLIHVESDEIVAAAIRQNECLGVLSDGCFAPGELDIVETYNENCPIRLIYHESLLSDSKKAAFLKSLIREIEKNHSTVEH